MKILKILIFLLIFANLIFLGYLVSEYTGKAVLEQETANLTRVIDGDTFESSIGTVRLLGINTPEKNQLFYQEAKDYLKQFENLTIELEKTNEDRDKYSRLLRYAFYNSIFINEEILARGLANLYVYQQDIYTKQLEKAETQARNQGLGIWKKSQDICANCITLKKLNPIDPGEFVILKNSCNFPCNLKGWQIKDTANHITKLDFSIQSNEEKIITFEGRVWNDAGDNFFLRDNQGLLVIFYRY